MKNASRFNTDFQNWLNHLLGHSGISSESLIYLKLILLLVAGFILSYITWLIAKKLVDQGLSRIFKRTRTQWDDVLMEKKVFDTLAHIAPALVIKFIAPLVLFDFPKLLPWVYRLSNLYILIVIILVINSFLNAILIFLREVPSFKDKPIDSYFQLTRIVLYIIGIVFSLSILMGKTPLFFLSAFGAMTAVLLLIFRDTILGLVASVQISSNDMIRVGDWISVPKHSADGAVVKIDLLTVKVQNWDKTYTTVPTYSFISDSFTNWRGMQESGGRRIKRSLQININSIRFCTPEMTERYKKFELIAGYIKQREVEIKEYNKQHNIDKTELINGRQMTNVGVFRNYLESYLKNLKTLRQDLGIMVRQLPPSEQGVPIEIYCFAATTVWADYEGIQADIFDHIFAAVSSFDLEIFQNPTGRDITTLASGLHLS